MNEPGFSISKRLKKNEKVRRHWFIAVGTMGLIYLAIVVKAVWSYYNG